MKKSRGSEQHAAAPALKKPKSTAQHMCQFYIYNNYYPVELNSVLLWLFPKAFSKNGQHRG